MLCKACGMEIPDHAAFCPKCGVSTSSEKPEVKADVPAAPPLHYQARDSHEAGGPPTPPPPQHYREGGNRTNTSGLSIASLVTGILGLLCFPIIMPILAIVLGALAKSEIKKSKGRVEGSGMATAGITLGIVALIIPLILAAIFVPLIVNNVGDTRTINRSVMLDGATLIDADLKMQNGSLELYGGADPGNMLEGTFRYNVNRWKPEITHSFSGSTGKLTIEQPKHWWTLGIWSGKNAWKLRLNNGVPVKLTGRLSSAGAFLHMSDIDLESLDFDVTSGTLKADVSGDKKSLKSVKTNVTSGNTSLKITGAYSQPVDAIVKSTSGDIEVYLTGSWEGNLDMAVETTSGDITILLPDDVGVYVTADVTSGDVKADDLNMREDGEEKIYSNDAYKKTDITLFVDVRATSGDITLQLNE